MSKSPLPSGLDSVGLCLNGLVLETAGGCKRGQAGDMMMLGLAFIVTKEEIDEIINQLDEVLLDVEKKIGF